MQFRGRDSSAGRVLVTQAWGPEVASQNSVQKLGVVGPASNSSSKDVEGEEKLWNLRALGL